MSTATEASTDLTLDVHGPDGDTTGSLELPAEVFDAKANLALMHQVVVAQLAAARAGTHATKTRGQVRGGGAKPYRQKGTGRARQGSTRAPQFEGGGVVHGPQPRDYGQRTPKKMKAAALRGALSDRARNGRVHVVSSFGTGDVPSTRDALAVLGRALSDVERSQRVLVVLHPDDVMSWKSLRNIPAVHLLDSGQLNTYDVLVSDDVVFTEEALQHFLDGRAGRRSLPDLSTPTVGGDLPSVVLAKDAPVTAAAVDGVAADEVAADEVGADEVEADDAPYGAGSHAALADGGEPAGFPIKGNADSMLYHVPDSAFYDRTVAEVWFATEADAEAAGFSRPKSQRDDSDEESDQ